MKITIFVAILMLIPISLAFGVDSKNSHNYNLDDVAFKICKTEYALYEYAAFSHIGYPEKLNEWKQYTQCHDDAFVILQDTQHLCSDEVKKLENIKTITRSLDSHEWDRYAWNLASAADDAIDCHIRVHDEEITKLFKVTTQEPIPMETQKPKETPESKIIGDPATEPEPPHTAEELDELCRTNQALCQPPIQEKTTGSDAPFFGIFAYLDDWISWIMGK